MLSYGGCDWVLDCWDSPVQARIGMDCREAIAVHWQVDLQYVAAGKSWQNAKCWARPTLRFCLYGFEPGVTRWEDLEGLSFASDDPATGDGTLFVERTGWNGSGTELGVADYRFKFVKRRANWFTLALEVFSVQAHAKALAGVGHFAQDEPPPGAASIIESVPFGLVEVQAPVNANPERYARAKAAELVGLRSYAVCDYGPHLGSNQTPVGGMDWRVRLHHGNKWTHFTL